jgi:hypothetical protein
MLPIELCRYIGPSHGLWIAILGFGLLDNNLRNIRPLRAGDPFHEKVAILIPEFFRGNRRKGGPNIGRIGRMPKSI